MELEFKNLSRRPLQQTHLQRFELLKDLFEVDTNDENKIYYLGDNRSVCLGRIMVGERSLIYHRYVPDTIVNRENIPVIELILNNVDYIIYETLTHSYQITAIRALEFGLRDVTFVVVDIPQIFWEVRFQQKQTIGGTLKIDPTEERRRNLFGDSWYSKLESLIKSEYMVALGSYLKEERKIKIIYPEEESVFRAFKLCPFNHTKVVILGKNPYYTPETADGLAFSYKSGIRQDTQKALDIILEEIESDCYQGFEINREYNLSYLAYQGVLLLNSSLTVVKGDPNSHLDIGWQRFIKIALYELMIDSNPKVFMGWGSDAQKLIQEVIDRVKSKGFEFPHLYLAARHPAYDVRLRNSGSLPLNKQVDYPITFRGCEHFSKANEFIHQTNDRRKHKFKIIQW